MRFPRRKAKVARTTADNQAPWFGPRLALLSAAAAARSDQWSWYSSVYRRAPAFCRPRRRPPGRRPGTITP